MNPVNENVNAKRSRPVNLDLATVRFPITAIVSITHRISGVVLLAGVLVLLWMLDLSLASEQDFLQVKETLNAPLAKLIVWAVIAALAYHTVMGIRHLIMDMGLGETLKGGKFGAAVALAVAVVLIVLSGVWVW